jgi:hypothetical protein
VPTVARVSGHRFFFYSNEGSEPPHVHVENGSSTAKVWLIPVSVARSTGFSARELNALAKIVEERRTEFLKAWNDHFAS